MAGEIMCKEDGVVNIMGALNAICIYLQNVENDLNGIEADASSLGLTNLNISQVLESINANKEKIKNMMQFIKSLLEGLINAEEKNIEIADKLYEIGTGILDGISNAILATKFLQSISANADMNQIKQTKGNSLKFLDNIEYTPETYDSDKIKEILKDAGLDIKKPIVKEFTVWVPSTMDENNKTEYAIMFYNGGYNSEPQKISTIIQNSELKDPYAIIIEFISESGMSSNPWLVHKTTVAQETKAILDYVYNQKGLLKESTTGIAVRI